MNVMDNENQDNENQDKMTINLIKFPEAKINTYIIKCINCKCSFHEVGFKYSTKKGKLTDFNDSNAYDLIINCPNGHDNKIWLLKNDNFMDTMIGIKLPSDF